MNKWFFVSANLVDHIMAGGRISESEFNDALEKFVELSAKLFDSWKIVRDPVTDFLLS